VTSGDCLKIWNVVDNQSAELTSTLHNVFFFARGPKILDPTTGIECPTDVFRLEHPIPEHPGDVKPGHNVFNLGHSNRDYNKTTDRA
jgi:hypothetical protein